MLVGGCLACRHAAASPVRGFGDRRCRLFGGRGIRHQFSRHTVDDGYDGGDDDRHLSAGVSPRPLPGVAPRSVPLDEFTSVPGTSSVIWVDTDGNVAVELVRGTLPPREYPGAKGEVEVAGARGVAGQFEDGTWVVAWFTEPGERCDLYTMVFYQPVEPDEVKATLASIRR